MIPPTARRCRAPITRRLLGVLVALCVASPSRPGTAQATQPAPMQAEDAVPDSELLPGDAIQVHIWREPDLSGDFVVNEEGIVTLPMLGRIRAVGVPVTELRARLIEAYERELRNPSITITPARRIYVLGEVNRPGLYGLDPTASLASAVALAGGANREGDLRKLSLIRDGQTLLSGIDPRMDLLSTGIRSGDQVFVDRRSWLERNQNFVVSSILGVAGIIVAVIR